MQPHEVHWPKIRWWQHPGVQVMRVPDGRCAALRYDRAASLLRDPAVTACGSVGSHAVFLSQNIVLVARDDEPIYKQQL